MSYLKPLLPFSSSSSTPSTSSSSSLKSYPPSPTSPTSTSFRSKYFPPLPPRKILLPLLFFAIASYAFISSTNSPTSILATGREGGSGKSSFWSNHRFTGSKGRGKSGYSDEEMEVRWKRATKPLSLESGTLERLKEWEETLIEVEPGEWVQKNLETCPEYRTRPNQNGQMLDKAHLIWSSMSTERVMGIRKEMIDYLREKEKEGALSRWGEGKGLVFTAGNADTFSRVLLTLKMLHNQLSSPLPSEIFSFPSEIPSSEIRSELESYNATFRIVNATRDSTRTKNYHLKATAIIDSRFREVLYLDSDNIPTGSLAPLDSPIPEQVLESARKENRTDPWVSMDGEELWGKPSGIWESKGYKRLGVMFWPDYWRTMADNPIWAILGVPCRDEWEQEAGQILVDKKLHLDALLLAEWMMDSSRFKYWFNFSDGDKDMFRFAFLAMRKRWAVPGRYVAVGALPSNTFTGFCGHSMIQHDHLGRPLFNHANLLKQIPSGVRQGYAWGRSRQIRTQSSSLTIPQVFDSATLEETDPLTDDDIDCDMLANAQDNGLALGSVPPGEKGYRTRRRAVVEKGIRAGFHGGGYSALCIDYRYEDPRTSEQIDTTKLAVAQFSPNPKNLTLVELAKEVDVCYCASGDGFETRLCGQDWTEVVNWGDDSRLKGFEDAFFKEGGKLNGAGF